MKLIKSLICLFFLPVVLSGQVTYLHCGMLIDMTDDKVENEKTIIIEGDRIVRIEDGYLEGNDTISIIDLKSQTVMPGFMDMHVHIEHESSPTRYLDKFSKDKRDMALGAVKFCQRTLDAGFTFVRDLGGTGVNVSLRNAINNGDINGPRIFTCEKSLATTGGHADPSNGVKDELKGDPGPKEGVVNST
ncbi:MAG: amidohydrolase family protein, partial [Bacteroidia bacterium]|nr:amidohydrolase family protein [Bacteroidia bacterium]